MKLRCLVIEATAIKSGTYDGWLDDWKAAIKLHNIESLCEMLAGGLDPMAAVRTKMKQSMRSFGARFPRHKRVYACHA